MSRAALVFLIFVMMAADGHATVVGTSGQTYMIQEESLLEVIQRRAKGVNWRGIIDKQLRTEPEPVRLPRATKPARRMVDLTFTLDQDLTTPDGRLLYPRGFRFNPLQYAPLQYALVFVNLADQDQLRWLLSYLPTAPRCVVMFTDGNPQIVRAQVKNRIYRADERFVRRFDIRALPAIATMNRERLEIKDIPIKKR